MLPELKIERVATVGDPGADWTSRGGRSWPWCDPRGVQIGTAGSLGAERFLRLDAVGLFRFGTETSAAAVAEVAGDAAGDEIAEVYRRQVLPLILEARGLTSLHASAVVAAGGVAVLCGDSGTGKSTLAAALGLSGAQVAADDLVPFEPDGESCRGWLVPFRLRLLPDAFELLGFDPEGFSEPPSEWLADARRPPRFLPIRRVVLLERRDGAAELEGSVLEPLPAPIAFPELLKHCWRFDPADGEATRRMAASCLHLVGSVEVARLAYPSGPERFRRTVRRLRAVFENDRTA